MNFSEDLVAQEPTAVEVGAEGEGYHLEQELAISESANQLLQTTANSEAIAKMILDDIIEAMFDNNTGNLAL